MALPLGRRAPGFHLVFPGSLRGTAYYSCSQPFPNSVVCAKEEVDPEGLEPSTPTMPLWCAPNCATGPRIIDYDGAEGTRTPDLYSAIVALSQLSHSPLSPRAKVFLR